MAAAGCHKVPTGIELHPLPHHAIYALLPVGDSIVFSLNRGGLRRLHTVLTDRIDTIALSTTPLRDFRIVDHVLYAISYIDGLFRLSGDSLHPVENSAIPGWSLHLDEQHCLWICGTSGIYRQVKKHGSFHLFNRRADSHACLLTGDTVWIAHQDGIDLYNRSDGAHLRHLISTPAVWNLQFSGSRILASGRQRCLIFDRAGTLHRTIRFGPAHNIAWAATFDSHQRLHIGTERGLFLCSGPSNRARLVAYPDTCVKNLLYDSGSRLWIALFMPEKEPTR